MQNNHQTQGHAAVFNVTFNNKGSLGNRGGKKRSQYKEEVAVHQDENVAEE